ncbi:ATP-binding protein [Stratiformator vulcanicus]|uniref:Chromosome segregation protein n=1 Tax=Stratiformator vulcanicus TaxID=2527980 RepID=A0A517QX85_9PLAN|nr:SbcC/MukB-like Walker B domain-containing protein [Stratiformator vulcanicus]QDT36276.1 chromosome segregation protein [Stratiformator vulcanicus]
MKSQSHSAIDALSPRGFRLHRVELLNWGTFHEKIFSIQPNGDSALLIGQNGSGKSTIVDALLTLLVRPGVRNFNVAAGAKKRERDEKSYLLGAYDRGGDEDSLSGRTKYLRPKGDHYTVILATFCNLEIDESFTVAQLLYLSSDQTAQKIYCFAGGERSIQSDFRALKSADELLKTLKSRGFKATKTFQEYEGWLTKATRTKAKAMEVFNQTVAVKDIQKLNDFIRNHMLEAHDWGEKVDRLLSHFNQLSTAHDSLVKVRQQRDYLEPIGKFGQEYATEVQSLEQVTRLKNAAGLYFAQRTIDLFTPHIEAEKIEHAAVANRRRHVATEIDEQDDSRRSLQNQIEQAGGDRLKEIPRLIDVQRERAESKRQRSRSYEEALQALNLELPISEEEFKACRSELTDLQATIETGKDRILLQRDDAVVEVRSLSGRLRELRGELAELSSRRENLPGWCVSLRHDMCQGLGFPVRDLPFAAELIQVHPDERDWESSIEKVLRGFALSLLVPQRYYVPVTNYVEQTRLAVGGRGQRLVYLRVGEQKSSPSSNASPHSLLQKLDYRDGHPLLPWLKAELVKRFDYACCDTIKEFRVAKGLAMTANRHVKSGSMRHDKDDRDHILNPRNFVLGWDNREKKRRLAEEIEQLANDEAELSAALQSIDEQLAGWQRKQQAVEKALEIPFFERIDFESHEDEIQRLEAERRAIESKSSAIQTLKARLDEVVETIDELKLERDQLIGDERELQNSITSAKKQVDKAERQLKDGRRDGRLEEHRKSFEELDLQLADPPMTAESLWERSRQWRDETDGQIADLNERIEPIRNNLTDAMSRFLRVCPERAGDLRATPDYVDDFLQLRSRILEDDLPRFEQRFKERLNRKVIEEIGLFRSSLQQERREIENKIELLNRSLWKLDYRPGMHIRLEPRPIHDAEINDFRIRLDECVEGSFDDSPEANEARFLRIKDLILKLRDDDSRRWRDKVTDVRRWFDFVAAVVEEETSKIVSEYRDSSGQSGGEKSKLAFTILVAAIAYQYDLDPEDPAQDRFRFVVVDEMFSKVDDQYAEYALELFRQFGLQLLIVAPLDAKARVTQAYVGCYLHVVKQEHHSAIYEMTAAEFEQIAEDEISAKPQRRAKVR